MKSNVARKTNVVHLNRMHQKNQTAYRHVNKDPVIAEIMEIIRQSGVSLTYIANKSGVTVGTIRRWDKGETKRPQNITVEFVARACGYRREWKKS